MAARRIAFTGAQGVGKSTLVVEVRRRLGERWSIEVLDRLGSDIARLGVPLGAAADADTLCAFAALHLQRERASGSADILLFDRCLLDLAAYSKVTGCPRSFLGMLRELAMWSLVRFERIYYIPIEDFSKHSCVDRENDEFRFRVDAEIVNEAVVLGFELVRLSGTVPERADRVVADVSR